MEETPLFYLCCTEELERTGPLDTTFDVIFFGIPSKKAGKKITPEMFLTKQRKIVSYKNAPPKFGVILYGTPKNEFSVKCLKSFGEHQEVQFIAQIAAKSPLEYTKGKGLSTNWDKIFRLKVELVQNKQQDLPQFLKICGFHRLLFDSDFDVTEAEFKLRYYEKNTSHFDIEQKIIIS